MDWRDRQSIPLPPKPDEPALRTSPPPPYYPMRQLVPPPVPAPRPHGYVNEEAADDCYFQPVGDEEATQLVGATPSQDDAVDNPAFEGENVYLEGRPETIELGDLGGPADPGVVGAQNTDQLTVSIPSPGRDVVYAIRRESNT